MLARRVKPEVERTAGWSEKSGVARGDRRIERCPTPRWNPGGVRGRLSAAHELAQEGDALPALHGSPEIVGDAENGVVYQHLDVRAERGARTIPEGGVQVRKSSGIAPE